jgi:hypothetical protein
VRLRLTLLYGGLFLGSGVILLVLSYELMAHVFLRNISSGGSFTGGGIVRASKSAASLPVQQQAAVLHDFALGSGIALAAMAIVSVWLGWLMGGRVLRPLRTMTATARRISEANLHERLALAGPGDELRDLGDTIAGPAGERIRRAAAVRGQCLP